MTQTQVTWAQRIIIVSVPMLFVSMVTLMIWVVEIRSNRFTVSDGADLWRAMALKADAAGAPAVLARLDNLERQLERIEDKLDVHTQMHNPPAHDGAPEE
jgi:hypothetical protein